MHLPLIAKIQCSSTINFILRCKNNSQTTQSYFDLDCRVAARCRVQNDLLMHLTRPLSLAAPVIIKSRWPDCSTTGCFFFGKGRRRISSTPAFTRLSCCAGMRDIPENTIFTIANRRHRGSCSRSLFSGVCPLPDFRASSDRPAAECTPIRSMLSIKAS